MGQRRFGGPEGKVAFHKEMKATHEERKKADKKADKKDDKKATTPTAAQLATARGQRATARSNRLAPPAPPAPPVPLTAAQRAAAEGRRRNLIQQASAQGFSKGGVIKKSKTRKKSNIDGIARRGHTRAPHK